MHYATKGAMNEDMIRGFIIRCAVGVGGRIYPAKPFF